MNQSMVSQVATLHPLRAPSHRLTSVVTADPRSLRLPIQKLIFLNNIEPPKADGPLSWSHRTQVGDAPVLILAQGAQG